MARDRKHIKGDRAELIAQEFFIEKDSMYLIISLNMVQLTWLSWTRTDILC